nr:hypothetical protein [Tanacetum cinerariifolium]
MEECHKMLTDHIDWANPEGDQVRIDISQPLPLTGLPAESHYTGMDAKGFEFKHDYTIIESPRAVVFPVELRNTRSIGSTHVRTGGFGLIRMCQGARNLYMPLNEDSRPEGSFETWNALLVVEYEILTTDSFKEPNEHIISAFSEDGNPARANIKQALEVDIRVSASPSLCNPRGYELESAGTRNLLRDSEWLGRVVHCITGSMMSVFNASNHHYDSDSGCIDLESVVNISYSTTNKAFQVSKDPSGLESSFNGMYKFLAP